MLFDGDARRPFYAVGSIWAMPQATPFPVDDHYGTPCPGPPRDLRRCRRQVASRPDRPSPPGSSPPGRGARKPGGWFGLILGVVALVISGKTGGAGRRPGRMKEVILHERRGPLDSARNGRGLALPVASGQGWPMNLSTLVSGILVGWACVWLVGWACSWPTW